MTARMKKLPAVSGFTPTTYAVYLGHWIIKIYENRKRALELVATINQATPDDPETLLLAEWIKHMDAYRLFSPFAPQQTVAYVDTLEEAQTLYRPGWAFRCICID